MKNYHKKKKKNVDFVKKNRAILLLRGPLQLYFDDRPFFLRRFSVRQNDKNVELAHITLCENNL